MEIKKQFPATGHNQNAGTEETRAVNQMQTGSDADVDEEDEVESADDLSLEDGSDDDSRISAMTGDAEDAIDTDELDEADDTEEVDDMEEGEMANGEEGDLEDDERQ